LNFEHRTSVIPIPTAIGFCSSYLSTEGGKFALLKLCKLTRKILHSFSLPMKSGELSLKSLSCPFAALHICCLLHWKTCFCFFFMGKHVFVFFQKEHVFVFFHGKTCFCILLMLKCMCVFQRETYFCVLLMLKNVCVFFKGKRVFVFY
jgi:hypothetical protein